MKPADRTRAAWLHELARLAVGGALLLLVVLMTAR